MTEQKPPPPPRAEASSLGGRVKRYAKVSTAVGGLAARVAGEKVLGIKGDNARRAAELRTALGGLKGPLMKVAQILSTIPDVLPREYADELAQLQANAPQMGWLFVKRRMAAELGADWQGRFASFDHEASAAASLGQVHRAQGFDGRQLACKLQYPDMASAVEADLWQLQLIFNLYRGYDNAIDPSNAHAELSERLREEVDYVREAGHMRLYGHMLAGEPHVHVPEVVPDLSTGRLLTMTWLDGSSLLGFVDAGQDVRNAIAYNMFRAWYVPFYNFGVIHGDPHLGNYTVRPDNDVNLLDFGCVRVFSPGFVEGVIDLYRALQSNDRQLAVHAYERWGFANLSNEMIDVLNLWAGFVYGPLLDDRSRPIQETAGGSYGRAVAEKVHAELRRVGGVKPPREFVLVDRAAIGLGSVFLRLKAEINWHRLFHDLIRDFDVAALARRQAEALRLAGLA
ncbi:ABC1 kinase family protein [Telmatospirillum siberiense]|uniref:ABC transporter ATP-binding protein n=1 Tax=Telmatospirillum siberiense TaxID=382514 RepID=A0A2N3PN67_9PROT|nr:AarF/ABC1/UbiB kinase family protein [Telmatospirillum siberiense]PKU21830.1 ABC transporter ATP-binding protein [Telmatospirillum siberiense]